MKTRFSNTAILLFSRSAEAEGKEKRVFSRKAKHVNIALFQDFVNAAHNQAKATGLPVFWVDEHSQIGADFGERIANAFESIYTKGYNKVIAIGNDCPDLNTHILLEAAEKLNKHKLVLGPTQDGGSYLIGMHQDAFQKDAFANLPWQTASLYQALANSCLSEFGETVHLINVNTLEDLVSALSSTELAYYLHLLYQKTVQPVFLEKTISVSFTGYGLRGPPMA